MLLNIGAENIELCSASFHTGSESVAKSECRQLGNAVWEVLSVGAPGGRGAVGRMGCAAARRKSPGASCQAPFSCLEGWFSSRDSTVSFRKSPFSCCRTGFSCWKSSFSSRNLAAYGTETGFACTEFAGSCWKGPFSCFRTGFSCFRSRSRAGNRRVPARKWRIRAGKARFPAAGRDFPASGPGRVQEIGVFLHENGPREQGISAFLFAGGGFHNFS